MRRIALSLMAGVFLLILSGNGVAETYKIGVVPWAGWSPAHVAKAKGFWKDQGIDVMVFNFPSNMDTNTALTKKRIDIGFDMIGTAVGMVMEGTPVIVVAETDWSHGGDKIIVKKELNLKENKGMPIGVYIDKPSVTYFLNKYLTTEGLKISDFKIVQMETDILAKNFIIERPFKVIVSYDPDALKAEREGNGTVIATSATYEGCIPEGMLMMKDRLAEIPKTDLIKIFKGWSVAAQWIKQPENWKEYMDILNSHTFKEDKPYSEADLRSIVDAVRVHDEKTLLERNSKDGGLYQYLADLKAFLSANKLLAKEFTSEDVFNNQAIVEALSNN